MRKTNKNILFIILSLILLSSFVSALTPPIGGISYYNLSISTDLWGSNNGTKTGTTNVNDYPIFNISGDSSPNSSDFNGVSDKILVSTINNVGSISMWVKLDVMDRIDALLGHDSDTTQYLYWRDNILNNVIILNGIAFVNSTKIIDSWYNVVLVENGINVDLYLNGSYISTANSVNLDGFNEIGARTSGGTDQWADGSIDEIKFYNYSLSTIEIQNLYDYGNITGNGVTQNFSISAHSNYSGTSIINFSAYISNQSDQSYCYQETANISTVCGGLNTGSYYSTSAGSPNPYTYLFDGNWNTFTNVDILYINYTKPVLSQDGSKWLIGIQNKSLPGQQNISVTIETACWNYDTNKLLLRVLHSNLIYWQCYNGSIWDTIYFSGGEISSTNWYEEAMNWSMGNNTYYETTNGTIITKILQDDTNLYNITIITADWFPKYYINYNVSTNLNASLNQSIISFACYEKVSNNTLNCTNNTIYPDAGTYNFTINVTGYTSITLEQTITALDNLTLNYTDFYSSNLSINSNAIVGSLTTCSYNVTSLNYTWNEIVNGSPNSSIGLINGTYNVSADCTGFATDTQLVTITNTTQTITFNLYTTNSVNITFYDISTGLILNNTNITIEFIGATAINRSTSNGTLYVDLLNPSEYTLIYTAPNYRQGSYIFTLTNKTHTSLSLYLDKINTTSLVLISVKDKYSKDPIRNALVTVQRYASNTWKTEQILKTDFNGQTEGWFVVSTEFYNFLVTINGITYFGVINSNENKKTIYAEDVTNGITIYVDQNPVTSVFDYQETYGVSTSLNFYNTSNTTGYFIFAWDDIDNTNRVGKIIVKKGNTINCTTTATGDTGSITCNVNVPSATGLTYFTAVGYIDNIPLETEIGVLGVDQAFEFDWGLTGWFITLFMVIIGFTLFLTAPQISILLGTGIFGMLILFNVVFKSTSGATVILLFFLAFAIAKIPRKEGE